MEELEKQFEEKFNNSIEKEILKNLEDLKGNQYDIPNECKNLFQQAYVTIKSVEILVVNNFLVDSYSLLRTCMENIITSTMIAVNAEFYEEFKKINLRKDERHFKIQTTRNLFKNMLKEIEPELFDEISNRNIQEMLDELYNKLCNFTHSSPVVNLAVEMSNNGDDDILKSSIKMIYQFLKILLNSCMKYFTKNKTEVEYGIWGILTTLYFLEIDPKKYIDGRMDKYKEFISFMPDKKDERNIRKLQKEQEELVKAIQEYPEEFESFIKESLYMNNELHNKIETYYKNNLKQSTICKECIKNGKRNTLGMWHCGANATNGIMFVGKTAVTEDYEYITIPKDVPQFITGEKYQSVFWSFIQEISKEKYADGYLERICITNLIKCNGGKNEDSTDKEMLNCCLKNNYLIEEIKIVKPKYIIFFLNDWYKNQLFSLEDDKEIINENLKEYINGNIKHNVFEYNDKKMPKCYFEMNVNNHNCKCLLVGHPQGKPKEEYLGILREFLGIE